MRNNEHRSRLSFFRNLRILVQFCDEVGFIYFQILCPRRKKKGCFISRKTKRRIKAITLASYAISNIPSYAYCRIASGAIIQIIAVYLRPSGVFMAFHGF